MSESKNAKNLLLQKRLRFLLRAYIACWLVFYFAIKKQTSVLDVQAQLAQIQGLAWLTPMLFVWVAGTLTFALVAAVYWWLTRPPAPEPSWRELAEPDIARGEPDP